MTDVGSILADLDKYAQELDDLSLKLAHVEHDFAKVEVAYEEFVGAYEEGLWIRHVENGDKFPAEALRQRLARREMNPELLGKYVALASQRKRMEKRLSALRTIVDAKRSILSALKVEMEATR